MLRGILVLVLAALCACEEAQAPFNKVELEELLRKEHSTRISNIYDSENGIQCADCQSANPTRCCARLTLRPRRRRSQVHMGR